MWITEKWKKCCRDKVSWSKVPTTCLPQKNEKKISEYQEQMILKYLRYLDRSFQESEIKMVQDFNNNSKAKI